MKWNKTVTISLVLLILVAALYRIVPSRPMGFAPQIAMALFAGAVIRDKKWAFALPIFSMFLSDLLYQGLFNIGASSIPGFYEGQWQNYLLFAGITVIGFMVRKANVLNVLVASVGGTTLYYLLSNFLVWNAGAGYERPKTFTGLMQTMADGLPFYRNSLVATLVFGAILFGSYYLLTNRRSSDAVLN